MNESLLDLEAAVSKQLYSPYYEKYRIRIECLEMDAQAAGFSFSGRILRKRIHTTYTLINPKLSIAEETVSIKYNMAKPDVLVVTEDKVNDDIEKLVRLEKFTIKADEGAEINVMENLKFKFTLTQIAQVIKYDILAKLVNKGEQELKVSYDNKLVVDSTEVLYVPVEDVLYSRRLNKPAKSCTILYQYTQPTSGPVKLQASCFCTLEEYYKAVKINGGTDYVEIIADNWLLPWNGFCIIHMPEKASGGTDTFK